MSESSSRIDPIALTSELMDIDPATLLSAVPLPKGLTNDSFLIQTPDDQLVLRVGADRTDQLQIDRHSELVILKVAAAAGLGPKVLAADPDRGLLVTRYVKGPVWAEQDARLPANIVRLGRRMRALHNTPPPPGAHRLDLRTSLHRYWRELADTSANDHLLENTRRQRALRIASALDTLMPACLCHNDLHHMNIIDAADEDNLYLLDWEYAAIGPPLFDLASVCCYHGYESALRNLLLSSYAPGSGNRMMEYFAETCWLFDYIRTLWTEVAGTDGGTGPARYFSG